MEKLLTTKQVADLMAVSEKHVARLRAKGLKSIRLGNAVRYQASDIEAFLAGAAAPFSNIGSRDGLDD